MILIVIPVIAFVWWRLHRKRKKRVAELGPVGWVDGAGWGPLRPLARAENRRLLRHPAFIVGVVLTPVMLLGATAAEDQWRDLSPAIALGLVPLGWLTIVAVNLLALRPQRTGTEELWATLPASQPVRSAGLLSTMAAAVVVATALVVGFVVFMAGDPKLIGSPQWSEIMAGVVIVAGSVTVGVAVARWLPHPAVGVAAVFATALIQARFFELKAWPWNRTEADPIRFLAFLASPLSVEDSTLEIRPALWHVLYLVALVALMAGVTLARNGVTRPLAGGLAVTLVCAGITGWIQTRPPAESQIARMVSYLTEPEAHQVCETSGSVRYCGYPASAPDFDEWRPPVEAVRALLPPDVAARSLDVRSRVPTVIGNSSCGAQRFMTGLPREVAARLQPEQVWPDDGQVHPGTDRFPCGGERVHGFFLAVQTGSWAVGLPASPHHFDERCHADGQARAVAALWLGAAATPDGARILDDLTAEAGGGDIAFFGWNDPPMWGVRFTSSDARAARQLLDRPAADVKRFLSQNWAIVTDARTPSRAITDLNAVVPPGAEPARSPIPACP
jgi:hypothetical protein